MGQCSPVALALLASEQDGAHHVVAVGHHVGRHDDALALDAFDRKTAAVDGGLTRSIATRRRPSGARESGISIIFVRRGRLGAARPPVPIRRFRAPACHCALGERAPRPENLPIRQSSRNSTTQIVGCPKSRQNRACYSSAGSRAAPALAAKSCGRSALAIGGRTKGPAAICNALSPSPQEIRIVRSHSPVAQLVEQPAVNRLVVGSSPTGGACSVAQVGNSSEILGNFAVVRFPASRPCHPIPPLAASDSASRLSLVEMLVGHLQVVLGRDGFGCCRSRRTRRESGSVSASSVSRVLRRFWNGFCHGSRPALRMMRSSCVRRLALASR